MNHKPEQDDQPRTFDVALDWILPELGRRVVPDGGRVDVATEHESRADYDTVAGDLRVLGGRLSRIASAGTSASWALHVDGVATIVPATGRTVPVDLRDLLLGVRTGSALRLEQRVETERTSWAVRDADGAEIGEVADVVEHVAEAGAEASVTQRRRIEVSGWSGPFVVAAVKRLTKAGAVPSAPVSGDRVSSSSSSAAKQTVGAAVHAYLGAQHDAILRGDLALRRGGPAIHATRVAIRRVRSVLRIVDVTDPERTVALDRELAWVSGLLGTVRDLEVLRKHLNTSLHSLADQISLDAAAALIDSGLDVRLATARAELASAMASRRYLALMRTLREWRDNPPFTEAANQPQARLARYVSKAGRQLDERVAQAHDAEGLHRARKSAKRARYVATFAQPIIGKQGAAIKRAKRLQTRLGKHQDCVVAADFLRHIAIDARGEAAFGCGVLWVHEQNAAERARRRAVG